MKSFILTAVKWNVWVASTHYIRKPVIWNRLLQGSYWFYSNPNGLTLDMWKHLCCRFTFSKALVFHGPKIFQSLVNQKLAQLLLFQVRFTTTLFCIWPLEEFINGINRVLEHFVWRWTKYKWWHKNWLLITHYKLHNFVPPWLMSVAFYNRGILLNSVLEVHMLT